MENVIICVNVVTAIATVFATFYAACQLKLARDEYTREKEKGKREKAIQFAGEFQNLIAKELGFILQIYETRSLQKYIEKINYQQMIYFNEKELKENLGQYYEEAMQVLDNIHTDYSNITYAYISFYDIDIQQQNILCGFIANDWRIRNLDSIKQKIEEARNNESNELESLMQRYKIDREFNKKLIYYQGKISDSYTTDLMNLLNRLEKECMYFSNGLADEEVVYQSLHQVFLKVIKSLYITISSYNRDSGADKYYSNIIELYNRWAFRYSERQNIEKQHSDINVHKKKPLH